MKIKRRKKIKYKNKKEGNMKDLEKTYMNFNAQGQIKIKIRIKR